MSIHTIAKNTRCNLSWQQNQSMADSLYHNKQRLPHQTEKEHYGSNMSTWELMKHDRKFQTFLFLICSKACTTSKQLDDGSSNYDQTKPNQIKLEAAPRSSQWLRGESADKLITQDTGAATHTAGKLLFCRCAWSAYGCRLRGTDVHGNGRLPAA